MKGPAFTDPLDKSGAPVSPTTANDGRRESPPLTGCVLVVDDNEANCKTALIVLQRLGIRADAVADGQQAVRAVHSRRYDLILMDCQMPVFDGYEATAAIRLWEAEEGRGNVPIIALTASAHPEDRERCAAVGMNDLLTKPMGVTALRRVLERWLPNADRNAASGAPRDANVELSNTGLMHIDRDQFREMRLLLGDGFAEFVRQFHVNVHNGFAALRVAADAHDATALKRAAHKLKGTAGTLGLWSLAKQCARLEALGRGGNIDTATIEIERLQLTYRQLCRVLEKVA